MKPAIKTRLVIRARLDSEPKPLSHGVIQLRRNLKWSNYNNVLNYEGDPAS